MIWLMFLPVWFVAMVWIFGGSRNTGCCCQDRDPVFDAYADAEERARRTREWEARYEQDYRRWLEGSGPDPKKGYYGHISKTSVRLRLERATQKGNQS